MFNRFFIRLLFRLVDSTYPVDYSKIDTTAREKWLFESHGKIGMRDYFKYEDIRLLKMLGGGQEGSSYWILIGRRLQLMLLMDDARKAYELKKSELEKQKSEALKESESEEENG